MNQLAEALRLTKKGNPGWEQKKKKEGDQSANEKKEKTHELTAASHLAFMSGKALHAQIQEKRGPPSVCKREGVSVLLRGKGRSQWGKRKTQTRWQGRRQRTRI